MATTTRKRRSSYSVTPRWITPKRVILTLLSAVLIVVGTFGVRLALALSKAFHTDPFSAVIAAIQGGHGSSVDVAHQHLQRINIMLYGYGGGGHDGAFLTDSLMLVSIMPSFNGPPEIAEVSIPRDWYAPIQLGGGHTTTARINEAYADGMYGRGPVNASALTAGAAVANPTFEHLLGIHIDHWIGVDFQAFKQTVDAVGGVDVNVVNSFTDDSYPHGECDQGDCSYISVHFNSGMQHMNGRTALIFARSRHGNNNEGSDFARGRRQQLVIAALKQKVVSAGGIGSLPDLISALGDNVRTDMQIGDVESLYGLLKDVDVSKVEHISIDNTNFLYDCGYPYRCGAYWLYANDKSFASLGHFIDKLFPGSGVKSEKAAVTVEDASGLKQGASGRWTSLLSQLGFTASDGRSVAKQAVTQVIDKSNGADARTAQWLADYFGVTVTKPPPATPSASGGTATAQTSTNGGVVVVLGTSEEKAFSGNPGVGN
jgi:polyisoprenyl-teichoic acid--peptidoglycan teichoic acid transferase